MKAWAGKLTRVEAIKILERATDHDDPYWENVVDDHYDEATDTMPSIMDVFAALGVTREEYVQASGGENVVWPDDLGGRIKPLGPNDAEFGMKP